MEKPTFDTTVVVSTIIGVVAFFAARKMLPVLLDTGQKALPGA